MKIKVFAILSLIAGSLALASCIDDEATNEVIFNEDIAEIQAYLDTTTIVNVKEAYDEGRGITVIWQELSGSKDTVSLGDTLRVNYVGRLLSNKAFDTSIEEIAKEEGIFNSQRKYDPLRFRVGLGQLIAGFELASLQMEVGDKATVFIPSYYAYGRQGSSDGRIPPNTPIMFELELLEVTPGPQD
ncbi:FKBP-type peptidyl-prolyl cis-trans isomerase [Algoriphagus sp. AGSA1]|uniref:FKBP-type peptidyl-prolyl cis-trans isomerase n=1 Tax=Algoriphagus sp. AGSA1 TaxID=2907213 RepID=UPI001F1DAB68|nr:FKBP-type peptidyl-prolyl cis-trans isomerase [Algoriphagus sp. AGSA1]MCE7055019.1 FKBP-type peptidyl-prolyl cis-trans isomerase [Algoriphagus sp. AGSA1]